MTHPTATTRVLVTGAGGFIGRHCLPLLAVEFDEVHAVSRRASSHSASGPTMNNVVWHAADVLSVPGMSRVLERAAATHLLHLAWTTEHGHFWHTPENFRWLAASLQLARLFRERGGRRLVTAGTCAEYAPPGGVCREISTPAVPQSLYGQCKHGLRAALADYAAEHGLSYAHTRVFNVYGPGEDPRRFVTAVARAALEHRLEACGDGSLVRDYLHVQDVASAHVRLLLSSVCGCVNVASGQPVELRQIASRIADLCGVARCAEFSARSSPDNTPRVLVADTTRLASELNWRPDVSLGEGLAQLIHSYRAGTAQAGCRSATKGQAA